MENILKELYDHFYRIPRNTPQAKRIEADQSFSDLRAAPKAMTLFICVPENIHKYLAVNKNLIIRKHVGLLCKEWISSKISYLYFMYHFTIGFVKMESGQIKKFEN